MSFMHMSFSIKNNELLEKHNEIWGKVSKIIKKGFDSEPVYNDKCIKTKIKSYEKKSTQIFMTIRCQKKVINTFFLSVILIHSVFRISKNYYPQMSLEECKYVAKEKRCLNILQKK